MKAKGIEFSNPVEINAAWLAIGGYLHPFR